MVHSIPEYDKTGTPYVVWRMAMQARDTFGASVGFLIASPYDKLLRLEIDSIPVYMLPPIDWQDNFFADYRTDRREYLAWADAAIRDFQPTILHVYNFVGLSYQLLRLKYLHPGLKILRTITHTEDVCFNVDPVAFTPDGVPGCCPGPFPLGKCVSNYLQEKKDAGDDIQRQFADHYRQLNSYYQSYVDGVVFSGREFHDWTSKIFRLPEKRWLIPYGVPRPGEVSRATRRKMVGDPLVIGFFGGLGPRKGLRVVLEAIGKRPEIMRAMKLIIVGDIVENWTYQALTALQERVPTQVEIMGKLPDELMDETMRTVDIAVLPSLFESYNITLRELLLRGTPVIVSDTYGSEKICPGGNGFVFPRGDADALMSIFERIVAEPSLLEQLQAGARQTPIETLEEECAKLVGVYRSLLNAE